MKKVLIAVLSASGQPYPGLMEAQMKTWDSVEAEGVDTLFYSTRMAVEHPKLVCFDIREAYNQIGYKNLMAYRWALDHLDWDFMARVNASCYVRKKQLSEYVQTMPNQGLICGVGVGQPGQEVEWLWGGAQYVFSRDVVKAFVDNASQWDHALMEDVATSALAKKLGIPFNTTGRCCSINRTKEGRWLCLCYGGSGQSFEFDDLSEMRKAADQHFIRVKQDGKRHEDIRIMQELHKYGI